MSGPDAASRREFLLGLIAGGGALGVGWRGDGEFCRAATFTLAAARRQAAHRRRRVIYNNDGDDIWTAGADTVEKFLAVRHQPLLQTHVDSVFYCTTQSFNYFTHNTKAAEIFSSREGKFANNNLARFLAQQTDGLKMSSEFARAHGMESIWTLRMNDIHDAWTPQFRPKWKSTDPKRVMSTLDRGQGFRDRRRLWSLVDFEHPDVEPRLLEIIGEVLRNYAVDGVELDFLRAPFYFRTHYNGQPATAAQTAVMTHLVRNIRKLVLSESDRQGKPLLLTARVPTTVKLCRRLGLDATAWFEEKLIDVAAVGGGYITYDAPVKAMIDLCRSHDIPAYPCISQSGLMYRPPRGKSERQPAEAWFGVANRFWREGAAGIYTFNLFPGPGAPADLKHARQVLSAIGSPDVLAKRTKVHAISDAGWWMPAHYWAKDAAEYSQSLPLALKANEFVRTSMHVSEDVRQAGFDVTAELRLDFTGLDADSQP
ncbi:MAG: hypothetical protein QF805_28650, partial [Pirellulaceae bacterium]|nr:hypothetical protein [Pirellulaceae bacterium]